MSETVDRERADRIHHILNSEGEIRGDIERGGGGG